MSSGELEFEQIHAAFRPRIHRYLARMVGDYEAEDLTQDVFVKVSQALKAFRGECELSTWIYRIAANAALDRLRKPSFKRTVETCGAEPAALEDESGEDGKAGTDEKTPLVEQQVYRKEMNDCIQSFVNRLPEAYRTVLVLSEFEGLSNNEIAEILGVALDTVKIRLHRAREKLKEQLAAHCGYEWVEGNEFVPELKLSDLDL